jgi:hypothetical protein
MNPASPTPAERILAHLQQVQAERALRAADAGLSAQVAAVKAYQRDRFARSHADLLAHPRYGDAARFFLDDLYGPQDFAERDAQFARIVPALVRLFPSDIVATVESLAALHALSESLDSAMGRALAPAALITAASYAAAWQAVGRAQDRERQVALVVALGRQLDRYTRNRLLRQSLRLMRGPARSAGLGALQAFLERGFDTFGSMRGADEFLVLVEDRERSLMRALFAPDAVALATGGDGFLGQLP